MTAKTLPVSSVSCRFLVRTAAVVLCGFVLTSASVAADLTVRIRSFPADASVVLIDENERSRDLQPTRSEGTWRVFSDLPSPAIVELRAPGYRTRRLHIDQTTATSGDDLVSIEERLLPRSGPLVPVAEAPTGSSPKSAYFVDTDTVIVPLLRDSGIDTFRIVRDRWSGARLVRTGRFEPPPAWAREEGFVEALVVPEIGEIWVSQMTTAMVHRFEIDTYRWIDAHPTGGGWPKVLAADPAGDSIWITNWRGESVVQIDDQSGVIRRSVPLGGQPRGLAFVREEIGASATSSALWVCLFSSGELVRVDTQRGVITDRIGSERGAARHIVQSPVTGRVFFSDMYHGTVNVLDPVQRRITRQRRVGINVNTIAVDPENRYLYVSERGRNNRESYLLPGPEFGRILVLDPETLETVQEIYGRHQPTGLAVSPDGEFVVATDFLDDNVALYRVSR